MHIHHPDMHIKYWAYKPNLMGISVSGTYFAIPCAAEVAVSFYLSLAMAELITVTAV